MRIAYSFLIVLVAVFLFLLPITDMVYDYRTEERTDSFTTATGVGVTTANVTLHEFIYDDDTSTVSISSSIAEAPAFSSYNGTTKTVLVASLTDNTTRTLEVSYDIDAITDSDAINNLLDRVSWIWLLIAAAFPVGGLAAIWTGRG